MPTGAFSVGRDTSLVIFTSAGLISTVSLKSFDAKPIQPEVKQELITGVMLPAYLFGGWEGSLAFARVDASLDTFFANAENTYYAGGDLFSAQITQAVTNPDGSINQFMFTNVALKLDDPGSWAGNREVDQKLSFMASRRLQLS